MAIDRINRKEIASSLNGLLRPREKKHGEYADKKWLSNAKKRGNYCD